MNCKECGAEMKPFKTDKMVTIRKADGRTMEVPVTNVLRCADCMHITFEIERN